MIGNDTRVPGWVTIGRAAVASAQIRSVRHVTRTLGVGDLATAGATFPWLRADRQCQPGVVVSVHGTRHPLISSIVLGSDCEVGDGSVDSLQPRRTSNSRRFSRCARIAGIARTGL